MVGARLEHCWNKFGTDLERGWNNVGKGANKVGTSGYRVGTGKHGCNNVGVGTRLEQGRNKAGTG